jgi:hypothetical protein
MNEIAITNAPWWANHSYVQLKGLYLAEDEAYVANSIVSITGAGTANTAIQTRAGDQAMLKVQRMVAQGTVSVMLRGGQKYEVSLPGEVGKLLSIDLAYISAQIDALSQPMSAEEQASFLASQNGHVAVS